MESVLVALAASTASAAADAASPRAALLDVPYLSQTQQLCGGAAVAMVLRYWGERNVFAQDFASLVEPTESGIRTSVLTDDVVRRGWQAVPASIDANASAAWLAGEIGKGRPVIALIEVSARTYHYVVVVGVTATEVVYHDPARAPFRVVPTREFDDQWAAANRWTLVVLPAANRAMVSTDRPAVAADGASSATDAAPCSALVAHSVTLARSGLIEEAERGLLTAQTLCPSGSAVGLELGGVRFLQRRYEEAETLAAEALEASPRDETAWDLLATSRYLQGDLLGCARGLESDRAPAHGHRSRSKASNGSITRSSSGAPDSSHGRRSRHPILRGPSAGSASCRQSRPSRSISSLAPMDPPTCVPRSRNAASRRMAPLAGRRSE